MKYHYLYLDESLELKTTNGFYFWKKMEWIQSPEWYLLAVVRHEGILQVAGTTYPFAAGSVIVVPPGSRCRIEGALPETRGRHWWFNFRPSASGLHKVAVATVTGLGDRIEHWAELLTKSAELATYTKGCAAGTLWAIMWDICENAAEVRCHPALVTVERHVNDNLAASLSVADLAEAASLSHNHLIRLFREEHGMTPTEYIRAQRMNKACQLLLATDLAVKEIGQRVGYSNAQHFHTLVKQTFGCSPQDIRTHRSIPEIHKGRTQ